MGIYGIDFYGVGRFGRDPSVVRPDFSVAPFNFIPLDYSTLHLTWRKPRSTDCVNLRLVRNGRNLPQSAGQAPGATTDFSSGADGTTLFTDVVERPFAYTDSGLGQGFYYYTMFGWSQSTSSWVRCSDLIALVPINWGYGYRLYHLLPMAYRDADIILVDPYNPWALPAPDGVVTYIVQPGDTLETIALLNYTTVNTLTQLNNIDNTTILTPGQTLSIPGTSADVPPQPPLQRYLNLIGFQLDFIRTEMESLMSINDPLNCSGALLPLMAHQLALVHEPEIGMQQERQLVQNAVHLYKIKGSPRGLTEFTSILTSYPATSLVHHGYNVMLVHDDSSFADGIGTWQLWPPTPSASPSVVPVNSFPIVSYHAGVTLTQVPNLLTASPATSNPVADLYPPTTSNPGGGMPISIQPPYGGVNANSPTGLAIKVGNSLSTINSSFAAGTTGTWVGDSNTNIDASTNFSNPAGGYSMRIRAKAAGNVNVTLAALPNVAVGSSYTASALLYIPTGATVRQAQISIRWYQANGTALTPSQSALTNEIVNGWLSLSVTGTAPTNTAYANITVQINSLANTTEAHYLDAVSFLANSQDIYITTGPIPITEFMSSSYQSGNCTFQVNMFGSTLRTATLSLWGDVGNGTPVAIGSAVNFTEQAGKWTLGQVSAVINPYPTAPPAGTPPPYLFPYGPASYYWIYPRIRIQGVTPNETHYITLNAVWNCDASKILTAANNVIGYDYPRDVKILLQPQSSNLLSNTCTTFTRANPAGGAPLRIGFDGLSALADPTQAQSTSNPLTCTLSIRYASAEDDPGTIAVNGNATLEVDTKAGGTVWFGKVTNWSAQPPNPLGWWPTDWFPGAHGGSATARPWTDSSTDPLGWFTMPELRTEPPAPGPAAGNYFGVGSDVVGGVWFSLPPQPTQYNNLGMYTVQSSQSFNFSVYGRYASVVDASNAAMVLGLRWFYADGSHVDATTQVQLTNAYDRYAIAPGGKDFNYLGEPPPQANPPTGNMPVGVLPFVQFPNAMQAIFYINSAMLSPTITTPSYMDSQSYSSATGDFISDTNGASYLYNQRTPRVARLNMELYRWLPMGSTYTVVYASGATMPPLDPTLW